LAKKDDVDPEELKKQTNELQQASLKLFEMAYKKVFSLCKNKFILNAITMYSSKKGERERKKERESYYLNILILQMAAERESQNQSPQESEGEKKEEKN